jgi:hypothetical protein
MIIDTELKAGLVFGIEADSIVIVEEGKELELDNPPAQMITIYLGFIAIHILFE